MPRADQACLRFTYATIVFAAMAYVLPRGRPSDRHTARGRSVGTVAQITAQDPQRSIVIRIERIAKPVTQRARSFAANQCGFIVQGLNPNRICPAAPSSGTVVRGCRGAAVTTACSENPRAEMVRAPKTHNACQSPGSAIVIANTGTCDREADHESGDEAGCIRNHARGFFIIHLTLVLAMMAVTPGEVGALARLWPGKLPDGVPPPPAVRSARHNFPRGSVRYRTDTAACLDHCEACLACAATLFLAMSDGWATEEPSRPARLKRKSKFRSNSDCQRTCRCGSLPEFLLFTGGLGYRRDRFRSIPASYAGIPDER